MIRVFMPKPSEDWVCDHIIEEFHRGSRHEIVGDPRSADVIFLYAKWIYRNIPHGLLKSRIVITTVHHIVPEKTSFFDFQPFMQFTDVFHVPNEKTEQTLSIYVQGMPIKKLPYWVNDKRWRCLDGDRVSNPRLMLASFQRDTEGNSIGPGLELKPKLEKGPDVFVDVVKRFHPDEVQAFVPGWRRDYIVKQLEDVYDVTTGGKLPADRMNDLYNEVRRNHGVYLVTSRYEGGPQAVLEAAQTKTMILSTDVGIASEILHPECICHSVDEFESKLRAREIEKTIQFNFDSVQSYVMDLMIPSYDDFIESVVR